MNASPCSRVCYACLLVSCPKIQCLIYRFPALTNENFNESILSAFNLTFVIRTYLSNLKHCKILHETFTKHTISRSLVCFVFYNGIIIFCVILIVNEVQFYNINGLKISTVFYTTLTLLISL